MTLKINNLAILKINKKLPNDMRVSSGCDRCLSSTIANISFNSRQIEPNGNRNTCLSKKSTHHSTEELEINQPLYTNGAIIFKPI